MEVEDGEWRMPSGLAIGSGIRFRGTRLPDPASHDPVSVWFEPDFRADVPSIEDAEQLVESLRATFADFGIDIETTSKLPPNA